MEQQGLISKVHGGIVATAVAQEPPYGDRSIAHYREKLAIAARAVQEIKDGQTLYLDSGTTLVNMARLLPDASRIHVFTNSLVIAEEVVKKHIPTYVLGGALRAGELSLSGALGQTMARSIHVDRAYFGAGALSFEHGVMDYHIEEAALRRTIGGQAGAITILADSNKYGRTGVMQVFDWTEVSQWITDEQLEDAVIERLGAIPVAVVRCEVADDLGGPEGERRIEE
jgi:DeoR/GlpR family transcriptional regulator of sugar metabolism